MPRTGNAPDWAKGMMDLLKFSVSEIKSSTKKLKHEIEGLRSEVDSLKVNTKERLDNLEKSNQFYSDKFDSWQEEKSVLLQQVSELKTEYQLKMDEAEQYSRRNCLIITGVKEKEGEDTDRVVLDIFEKKLNICLDIFQVDRSHRLNGPKRPESDNSQVIRPIIVKFATYQSRNLVFKAKKLLKGSGIAIFENLTTRRASLLKDVKRIAGNGNAWTMDGNILAFNMEGKIFTVRRIEDIRKVRPNYF